MLYKGKLDQIIMCLYVEVICKIQTMYVTNLRSGLEYIVKERKRKIASTCSKSSDVR